VHGEIPRQRRRGTVDLDAVVRCANGDVVLQQGVSVTVPGASGSVAMAMPSTPALPTRLPRNTVPATGPPGRGRRAAGAGDPRPDRAWAPRRANRSRRSLEAGGFAVGPPGEADEDERQAMRACRVVPPPERGVLFCSPADGAQERVTNVCGRRPPPDQPRVQTFRRCIAMLMQFDPFRESDRLAEQLASGARTPRPIRMDTYRRCRAWRRARSTSPSSRTC
jgi:hypothetical protein